MTPSSTAAAATSPTAAATSSTPNNNNNNGKSSVLSGDSINESCTKCVKSLRDLVSGLQSSSSSLSSSLLSSAINNNNKHNISEEESKPLQLLRAIAGANNNNSNSSNSNVKIENVNDGIKVTVPVKATSPTLLRRWSNWSQELSSAEEEVGEEIDFEPFAIATSARDTTSLSQLQQQQQNNNNDNDNNDTMIEQPLSIELKCRKCASTGPEAGARAFLMGPTPLSVVVCYNRVQSSKAEIQEILTHELIHLYDVQTQQLDLQQCENLAYSEVRAAKHAECGGRGSNNGNNNPLFWGNHLQKYCVKQKAICATNNLFPLEGRKCIHKVFDKAYNDNRPFNNNNNTNNK